MKKMESLHAHSPHEALSEDIMLEMAMLRDMLHGTRGGDSVAENAVMLSAKEMSREIKSIQHAGETVAARKVRGILKFLYPEKTIEQFVQEQPDYEKILEEAHHPESDTVKRALYGRHRPAV